MTEQSVGQIQLDLLLNSSSFKSQLQGAVNQAVSQTSSGISSKVGSTFSKLGKLAITAFSVKAITGFMNSSIELGSTLAEVQNVVDSTFTTMSEDVNRFATSSIKNFGLSESVAKKYVGTMGAMAKSFGFTEQEAFNMSTTLTGLVGDVASFYNLSSDQAYTKLKAVFTGETEALKDLGVVMTQTALDEFALAKGYGKTTAKMSEQEKVALRYAFVQDRLSTASGDYLRTMDGWANQMRYLSLQWQQFKANIGQGLIAVLTPLIKSLNTLMEKLVHLSAVFKATMEQIYGKQPESNRSGVGAISSEMAQLESNTDGVGTAAQKTAKKLKSLMGFDNLNILSNNSDETSSVSGAGSYNIPTTNIDTSANLLSDALSVSQEEIDKMKKALDDVLRIVIIIGSALLGWKIGNLIGQIAGLKNSLAGLGGAIALVGASLEFKGLSDAWANSFNFTNFAESLIGSGTLVAGASLIGKAFGSATLGAAIGGIVGGIPLSIVGVKDAVMNGLNWLNGIIIPAGTSMAGAGVGAIIGSLGGPIGTGLGALIGLILGLLGDLTIYVVQNWNKISAWFKSAWDGICNWFKNSWIGIKNGFADALNGIKGAWVSITAWFSVRLISFRDSFVGIFKNIRDNVVGVFDNIKTAIKTPINAIIGMLNKMIGGINNLKFDMPEWVPIVGGKSLGFSIPKIPMLAEGGYVGPNTPQLAMIGDNRHQGEFVAPENKLSETVAENIRPVLSAIQQLISTLLTQGQNSGGDITIPIYLDGSLLDEYIVTAQDRRTLRSGR